MITSAELWCMLFMWSPILVLLLGCLFDLLWSYEGSRARSRSKGDEIGQNPTK